jgi:hypothetical protein
VSGGKYLPFSPRLHVPDNLLSEKELPIFENDKRDSTMKRQHMFLRQNIFQIGHRHNGTL